MMQFARTPQMLARYAAPRPDRSLGCIKKFAIGLFCLAAGLTGQESPLPALPPIFQKMPFYGQYSPSRHLPDRMLSGNLRMGPSVSSFQFNDRGRGPKIYTTYRVDRTGLIVFEESKGLDYMKTPVQEIFSLVSGDAVWKNQAEDEKLANAKCKFYVDLNGGPEAGAILPRALLISKNGDKLPVLPSLTFAVRLHFAGTFSD